MNSHPDQQLMDSLPDLVISLGRDGTVLSHGGGRSMLTLAPRKSFAGKHIGSLWPPHVVDEVMHVVRKAVVSRTTLEVCFLESGQQYRVRVTAQGPTRALCVIRLDEESIGAQPGEVFDRRNFLLKFQDVLSHSVLAEKPMALIVLYLDGVEKIALIDAKSAELTVASAIRQMLLESTPAWLAHCCCSGQLNDGQLAFVLRTVDRESIEEFIAEVTRSIRKPVRIGELSVELLPYSGVALLGRDGASTSELLDSARIAASEARRTGSKRARFFSDTMSLRSVARLDIGRELRSAIEAEGIRTRHVGRYDMFTGSLVASVAYVRWAHPLRGEVSPREFLGIAESTGSAVLLSRRLLSAVGRDCEALLPKLPIAARISYGPLRQHLFHDDFLADIERFLGEGAIAADRFEIRIPETTFVVLPSSLSEKLHSVGVQLVVDEVARGMGSFDRLARSPIWGMQLDRAWVEALPNDDVACRVCRAGIATATALGIHPIASGVDGEPQREALVKFGCLYGSGDLYRT